jgi:cytochrome c peroxidase
MREVVKGKGPAPATPWLRICLAALGLLTLTLLALPTANTQSALSPAKPEAFTDEELAQLAGLGPWPEPGVRDPSNRFSGQPAAIALGEKLFNAPEISGPGTMSCASCHNKTLAFAEARPTAFGIKPLSRNTPSLMNLAGARWFGWDGGTDNLWAATLRPLLDADEMASTPAIIASFLQQQPEARLVGALGRATPSDTDDLTLAVNAAKLIAAYVETLRSPPSAFDRFRNQLLSASGSRLPASETGPSLSASAQRGLKVFLNNQCTACHNGPRLSNGEFHDIGIGFFLPRVADQLPRVDPGRHAGLQRLAQDPFTRLSSFSDASDRQRDGLATRIVTREHRNFGEWKTPSLRNLRLTAPYMHNGTKATLRDVVRHYSRFDEERVHADGEAILRPLYLSDQQIDDLVAFLESL